RFLDRFRRASIVRDGEIDLHVDERVLRGRGCLRLLLRCGVRGGPGKGERDGQRRGEGESASHGISLSRRNAGTLSGAGAASGAIVTGAGSAATGSIDVRDSRCGGSIAAIR